MRVKRDTVMCRRGSIGDVDTQTPSEFYMIELCILAVALSMDAMAVSIGMGTQRRSGHVRLGVIAGIYFGVSQGLMPLLGYALGKSLFVWIEDYASWLACLLLSLIGLKMLLEAHRENSEQDRPEHDFANINHMLMLTLAIATSIDAMAAGFSLTVLNVNLIMACGVIALTTFSLSWIGVGIGSKAGGWLATRAEQAGGITLILIGLKIALF